MTDLWIAFALVLVIEGAAYALFPEAMKRMMAMALSIPVSQLRTAGLFAMAIGIALVWAIRN